MLLFFTYGIDSYMKNVYSIVAIKWSLTTNTNQKKENYVRKFIIIPAVLVGCCICYFCNLDPDEIIC